MELLRINCTSKPIECKWFSTNLENEKEDSDVKSQEKYDFTVSSRMYILSSIELE